MSIKSVDWARQQTTGGPANKLVLQEMCDGHHGQDSEFCFNPVRIAKHCEMSLEELWVVLRILENSGFWSWRKPSSDEVIEHGLFPASILMEDAE